MKGWFWKKYKNPENEADWNPIKGKLNKSNEKNSVDSLFDRLDQIENRISGLEDKVDVAEQPDEEKGKIKKYK
jgi:hypothetical protein